MENRRNATSLRFGSVVFNSVSLTVRHGEETNPDYLGHLSLDPIDCWVIANGLRGHKGGETASRVAVKTILGSFRNHPEVTQDAIRQYLQAAHQAILNQQQADQTLGFMRATAILLVTDKRAAIWGHMGDSRLYAFRDGGLVFHTKHHRVSRSLASSREISPEDIRVHQAPNRLCPQAQPGKLRPTEPEQPFPLEAGDVLLLCTDGFWEQVTATEMAVDLAKVTTPEEWLEKMQVRLLRRTLAEDAPTPDSYTALAVFVDDDPGGLIK